MLRLPRIALLLVALVAVGPVLAGCSSFDPDQLDFLHLSDKKPLPGKREALFPNGVPGVTKGIPPQYREGYQAPSVADLPPGDTDATSPAGASRTASAAPTKPVKETNLGAPMKVHRTATKHRAKPKRHRAVKRTVKKKATATAARPKAAPKGTAAPWPSAPQQAKGTQAPWPSNSAPSTGTQAPWPSTSAPQQGAQAPWPSNSSASSAKPSQSTQAGWPKSDDSQKDKEKLAPWPSAPPSGSFSKQ
jgi:hypothetical protein